MTTSYLSAIYIDGEAVDGFTDNVFDYTVQMDINDRFDAITYDLKDAATSATLTEVERTATTVKVRIDVTSADGAHVTPYTVRVNFGGTLNQNKNQVVNKNGTDATVTFVVDDGDKVTASFGSTMLDKYDELTLSFGVYASQFATLKTETVDGKTQYVKNGDTYVYTKNMTNIQFWANLMRKADGRAEIVNHTYSHAFWGLNDDGGKQSYIDSYSGNSPTSATVPVGSSTKEVYAANQILNDLFPAEHFPNMATTTLINAGIGSPMQDMTVGGVTYVSYYKYFYNNVVLKAYRNGEILGMRQTFMVSDKTSSANRVIKASSFATEEQRLNIPAYMIKDGSGDNSGEGIENWSAYIDHAIRQKGWACFCIHSISDNMTAGHYINTANADALFQYASDKNVWIATMNDATKYYREWSTANITTAFEDDKVKVTLTDEEDNTLCDIPLTVRVYIPAMWDTAFYAGEELTVHATDGGERYVYVDILPDSGVVEITYNANN